MILTLALRNIAYRPWRSVLLFAGYGVGVAVMIVLLSVGEALLTQARDEKLVGGGDVTVLPEGIDVEVMKTGGIGGLFFSIDNSRFIQRQVLASPRLGGAIAAVAPQIDGRLIYLTAADGQRIPVRGSGEIPSANARVGAARELTAGEWRDDEGDRRWMSPTPAELRHEIDRFHMPPDTIANAESWAEWHYFNVLSADGKRWAFISFIVAGDVGGAKWGGNVGITLREQDGELERFNSAAPSARVRFSTTDANLRIGESSVEVLPDGRYSVKARAASERGQPVDVNLVITPAAGAWFPPASLGSGDFVSGYVVPALRASANGRICAGRSCENYTGAQAYHDHNWGVWKGVSWDWGATRAGSYTLLYGRVVSPDSSVTAPPLVVYLVDSLGFRAVFRPRRIHYEDTRTAVVGGRRLTVPGNATFMDIRGADTLRLDVRIEDAIATDMELSAIDGAPADERGDRRGSRKPGTRYFIQMKGVARISGRLAGVPLAGSGYGFFETYR